MKNFYVFSLSLFLFFTGLQTYAQQNESGWVFGLGYNFVDDSGTRGKEPFNIGDNWNAVFYPNRFSAGYALENGFTFDGVLSLNKYKEGNTINGTVISEDQNYYAVDGLISYDLNKFFANDGWFDPYFQLGSGISSINKNEMITFNAGLGFNFWVGENIAINLNTLGKWGLGDDSGYNHIQHAFGVVIRPEIFKKKITPAPKPEPQPEPEPEVVEEEEPEPAPVVEEVEEEPVPEKSEEELLREQMEQELADIQRVYYAFDSSYLTDDDKQTVDNLVEYMEKYPQAILEIQAHADSRGTEQYNLWLSERRASRIVEYAQSKGIDASRLRAVGFGENQLVNRCTEGADCTSEQHRENRRTEYVLIWE